MLTTNTTHRSFFGAAKVFVLLAAWLLLRAGATQAGDMPAVIMAFEDVESELSAQQVFAQEEALFKPRSDAYVGYTVSDWWLKVDLVNDGANYSKRYVVLPIPSTAPVYAYDQVDGRLREKVFSIDQSSSSGIDQTHVMAFDYLLSPGEQRTVLIRHVTDLNPTRLDFSVQTQAQFHRSLNTATTKLLVPLVALGVLLICNIFYGLSSRDKVFMYYSLYLAGAMFIPVARFGGLVYTDLPHNIEASFIIIGGATGYFFFALMLRTVLKDLQSRFVDWMCFGIVAPVTITILLISLFDPVLAMTLYAKSGGGGLIILSLLGIIIAAILHRHALRVYLAVGFLGLLVGSLLAILQYRGVLGSEFNGVLLPGIIAEAFVFTFVLESRFQLQLREQQVILENQSKLQRTLQLALLGEMVASISHELKQPLNAIKLVAVNLKSLVAKNPNALIERLPNKLDRILSLVDRAAELSDHVRRSSRLSTGETAEADIAKAITGCRLMIDPQLAMGGIDLMVDIDEDFPQLAIHPLRLDQVLLNIIGNAKDVLLLVNPAVKWIKVSAKQIEARRVQICVEDSAGGIPAESLDLIFDQFFTTKAADEGTGLGLSICKTIVEDAGGSISVVNTVNGARFCITLSIS